MPTQRSAIGLPAATAGSRTGADSRLWLCKNIIASPTDSEDKMHYTDGCCKMEAISMSYRTSQAWPSLTPRGT